MQGWRHYPMMRRQFMCLPNEIHLLALWWVLIIIFRAWDIDTLYFIIFVYV
jgi:hypothetical protein